MTIRCLYRKVLFRSFLLIVFLVLNSINLLAQVTIGVAEEPNFGALLDLKENSNLGQNSTRGLLLPRVSLQNINSINPILNADTAGKSILSLHTGLMVFNMTDNYAAELCRGVYVWTYSAWKRLSKPCCFQLKEIIITNPTLSFEDGDTAIFEANIRNPLNLQDPDLEYEWYLDGVVAKARSTENTFSMAMSMAYNGKKISVKAYNQCSESTSTERTISITSTCIAIQDVILENSLLRDDFEFPIGKEVEFYSLIAPDNASDLSFEWSFDGSAPIQSMSVFKTMEDTDNGKILKLKVFNECSSVTKEIEIKTYLVACPAADKDKINVIESNNKMIFTFDLYGLSHYYTQEDLDYLGVKIQWYKKQMNNSGGGHIDPEFVPIPGANSLKYEFLTSEYFGGAQDMCNIGVVVTGAEGIMDCPFKNSRSFSYKIISQGQESDDDYQGTIVVDNNTW